MKQLILIGLALATVWLVARLQTILAPVILALLLAYVISFPVNWIWRRTGWHRTTVVAVMYLLLLLLIITGPVLIVPRAVALVGDFSNTLVHLVEELSSATPKPIEINPRLTIDLGPLYAPISEWLRTALPRDFSDVNAWQNLLFPFASSAALVVRSAVSSLLWALFILVVSFYVTKDAPEIGRYILTRLPEIVRSDVQRVWMGLGEIWDAFIRGQITLSLVMGFIVTTQCTLLGIPNAPVLGILSALAEFIPAVGPPIAAAFGVLIALIFGSTWVPLSNGWFAVATALAYLATSEFENLYLVPRIIGRRISLHPIMIIIGALAGAQLGGVLGILLAGPVIASSRLLLGYIVNRMLDQEPFPPAETPEDQAAYWTQLLHSHRIQAVLFDLDGTLVVTNDVAVQQLAARLTFLPRVFPNVRPERVARRVLLTLDLLASEIISFLNQLRMEQVVRKVEKRLRKLRGQPAACEFRAVPGIEESLREVAYRYPVALVTGRNRTEALQFLAENQLDQLFAAVVTRNDVPLLKPHPLPLGVAARKIGVPVQRCVMVGDSNIDIRAAKAAGALSVGVLTGFGQEKDLRAADLVISSVAELPRWLQLQLPV